VEGMWGSSRWTKKAALIRTPYDRSCWAFTISVFGAAFVSTPRAGVFRGDTLTFWWELVGTGIGFSGGERVVGHR
jgi:hypothetical protein